MIPKRILILTADMGFGHRSAAQAVAAALQETRGDECHVNIVNPLDDRRVWSRLRQSQTNYDSVVRKMPALYHLGYNVSDARMPCMLLQWTLTVALSEVLSYIIRDHKPHAIIITHPFYQAPLRAVLADGPWHIPLITVITDLFDLHRLWFCQDIDLYLVPSPEVKALALKYGVAPDQVRVTGLPIHPAFTKETREPETIRAGLGWQPDLKTFLIVSSKRFVGLVDILKALNQAQLPLQLAVVTGGDDYLHHKLLEMEWNLPVHTYGLVDNMPTLMHAADAIICKAGGLIIAESLACGLPLILTNMIPGQELGNARYITQCGAGEIAHSPAEVLEIARHWLQADSRLLEQRAANARQLGFAEAAYLAANYIWTMTRYRLDANTRKPGKNSIKWMSLLARGHKHQADLYISPWKE